MLLLILIRFVATSLPVSPAATDRDFNFIGAPDDHRNGARWSKLSEPVNGNSQIVTCRASAGRPVRAAAESPRSSWSLVPVYYGTRALAVPVTISGGPELLYP